MRKKIIALLTAAVLVLTLAAPLAALAAEEVDTVDTVDTVIEEAPVPEDVYAAPELPLEVPEVPVFDAPIEEPTLDLILSDEVPEDEPADPAAAGPAQTPDEPWEDPWYEDDPGQNEADQPEELPEEELEEDIGEPGDYTSISHISYGYSVVTRSDISYEYERQENLEAVSAFLTGELGLSNAAAAGVLANIAAVSGFNPCVSNSTLTDYGICRWSGGRVTEMQRFCAYYGYDFHTLEGQLAFLQYELTGPRAYILDYFSTLTDDQAGAYEAGWYFCCHYVVAADRPAEARARGICAAEDYLPLLCPPEEPAEEAAEEPAEEDIADEAAGEPADETAGAPADETAGEPTEEAAEEPAPEAVDGAAEEAAEEPVEESPEESAEEPAEEAAEESAAEPAPETVDEAAEEPADETAGEPAEEAAEEPAEEPAEEAAEETGDDPADEAPEEVSFWTGAAASVSRQLALLRRQRGNAAAGGSDGEEPFVIDPSIGTGEFIRPVPYNGTNSDYGWRVHPIYNEWRFHAGMDLGAWEGEPIYAADNGTVIISGYNSGYGNYVVIDHNDGYQTLYAHQSALAVTAGDVVEQGQVIGYVGSTGLSTGPHLHYEVWANYETVEPADYIVDLAQNNPYR